MLPRPPRPEESESEHENEEPEAEDEEVDEDEEGGRCPLMHRSDGSDSADPSHAPPPSVAEAVAAPASAAAAADETEARASSWLANMAGWASKTAPAPSAAPEDESGQEQLLGQARWQATDPEGGRTRWRLDDGTSIDGGSADGGSADGGDTTARSSTPSVAYKHTRGHFAVPAHFGRRHGAERHGNEGGRRGGSSAARSASGRPPKPPRLPPPPSDIVRPCFRRPGSRRPLLSTTSGHCAAYVWWWLVSPILLLLRRCGCLPPAEPDASAAASAQHGASAQHAAASVATEASRGGGVGVGAWAAEPTEDATSAGWNEFWRLQYEREYEPRLAVLEQRCYEYEERLRQLDALDEQRRAQLAARADSGTQTAMTAAHIEIVSASLEELELPPSHPRLLFSLPELQHAVRDAGPIHTQSSAPPPWPHRPPHYPHRTSPKPLGASPSKTPSKTPSKGVPRLTCPSPSATERCYSSQTERGHDGSSRAQQLSARRLARSSRRATERGRSGSPATSRRESSLRL